MTELSLPQETNLALRAQAHGLDPVVLLGAAGLSEAALREIDRALSAHGLVKVRAGRVAREDRDTMFATAAQRLGAARIQAIGHTFVLFRPVPEREAPKPARTRRAAGRSAPARGRLAAPERAPRRGAKRGRQP